MKYCFILLFILLFFSCNQKHRSTTSVEDNQKDRTYIHYWDNIPLDSISIQDTAKIEQAFANYLALLSHEDSLSVARCVDSLIYRTKEKGTVARVMDMAYHYLYDPNSPMYNEDLYLPFLQSYLSLPGTDEGEKERSRYTISRIQSNRPGTLPPDFRFTLRSGTESTLRRYAHGMMPTLLVFYDPECENCTEILEWLAADEAMQASIHSVRLRVLAIYADGKQQVWQKHPDYIPAQWTDVCVASDPAKVVEDYDMRARPTLYLIDEEGLILLKDVQPERFLSYIVSLNPLF